MAAAGQREPGRAERGADERFQFVDQQPSPAGAISTAS